MIRMTSSNLDSLSGVSHGFFTREGGVSRGIYASLNCGYGTGDDPEAVTENRRRVAVNLGAEATCLVTGFQVHGRHVVSVEIPWAPGKAPEADAMITTVPGVALGILTADCAPILLAEEATGIVAAVHAGWKGALLGVIEAAVAGMTARGAEPADIRAAIGPALAPQSYEVGPEFRERFRQTNPAYDVYFHKPADAEQHRFDLVGFVVDRLEGTGVGSIETSAPDTYADAPHFFSYRRTCHRGEPDYGRQISAIMLRPR